MGFFFFFVNLAVILVSFFYSSSVLMGFFFFFVNLAVILVSWEACVSKGEHFSLVSMLKAEEPMVMEREVVWPWDASTWKISRQLAAKSMSLILVVILSEL